MVYNAKVMPKFLAKPRNIILVFTGIAAISFAAYFSINRKEIPEFVLAQKKDLIEEVSATGRVKAASSVNLAFEKSGRVSQVFVRIGTAVFPGGILIKLENAELLAQLSEAEANVKVQSAKLDEIKRGTRAEEIEVQTAQVNDAKGTLAARIQDAYTKSDDAIRNKVDQFISNSKLKNPLINFSSGDSGLKTDIESRRVDLEPLLTSWKYSLSDLNSAGDLVPYVVSAKTNLERIKLFLDKTAFMLSSITSGANLSQTTLDGYKSDISSGRSNIETAMLNLTSAKADLEIAEKELLLKQAPPIPEKILAQEAALEEALAKAEGIKIQIAKTSLGSPLYGTVAAVDAKVGEIISANSPAVSIISTDTLQVEVNIPEADVAKITTGQQAAITLDAYGSETVFEAGIVSIDPAEKIIEGVATYKATLQFVKKDQRVKSGMTANIDIITARRAGAIAIPQRAVFTSNGDKKVRVLLENGAEEERTVVTGLRGSDGNVEIVDGLKENERVMVAK